jgi:PadR family transcriptional regulator, regulatory protein PadR
MTIENTNAQMRRGILELCVLSIISQEEAYPSDIIQKLKEAKLIVVEGTLYPLLSRLKNAELLNYEWKESTSGPPRKYYSLTEEGQVFLQGLIDTWHELNTAVNAATKKPKKSTSSTIKTGE